MNKLILNLGVAVITFISGLFITVGWDSISNIPTQPVSLAGESHVVSNAAENQLRKIYDNFAEAQTTHDRAFFERVEASNYMLFESDGSSYSRSEDLKLLEETPTDTRYEQSDLEIRVYGDAAVVTGTMTAIDADRDIQSWKWLDVCLKRDGRWQIQSTTQFDLP